MVRTAEINNLLSRADETNRGYLQGWVRHLRLNDTKEVSIAAHLEHVAGALQAMGWPDAKQVQKVDIDDWYLQKRAEKTRSGKPPSPATLKGYIISLRAFYAYLLGEEGKQRVSIRIKVPPSKIHADELCGPDEVVRLMAACTNERDRAIIAVMYSSGARLGELCGANVGDVAIDRYGARIRVSGKTGERDITVFYGMPELQAWINVHPLRDDPNAPLWVTHHKRGGRYQRLSPKAVQSICARIGDASGVAATKKCNPHAYRHARATDLAAEMTTADMNLHFGWAPGSNMAANYVHSSQRKVAEALARQAGIRIEAETKPTKLVVQCPRCRAANPASAKYCSQCSHPLNEELARNIRKSEDVIRDML